MEKTEPHRALVAGDVMLDVVIAGRVSRITPDAPVPVVKVDTRAERPGGAANVAAKIAAFGVDCDLLGVTGNDNDADTLRALLASMNVRSLFLPESPVTTTKTVISGISAGGEMQKVTRIDIEETSLEGAFDQGLLGLLSECLQRYTAVVISDYGKGVCSDALCSFLISESKKIGIPVIVDSKNPDWSRFNGASLIKPNVMELCTAVNMPFTRDYKKLHRAANDLMRAHDIASILLSMDADGCVLLSPDGTAQRFLPATLHAVDVIGAGDAMVAAIAASLIQGASLSECARMGNIAGALAVEREGSSPITHLELSLRASGLYNQAVIPQQDVSQVVAYLRSQNKRIVFTNGCFDIIHRGHMHHLREARELGDVLIVAINSDDSVRRIKGEHRPLLPLEDRLAILSGLECVDYVVVFDKDSPVEVLKEVLPDILVKGANTDTVVGQEYALRVEILPLLDDTSSRRLLDSIKRVSGN